MTEQTKHSDQQEEEEILVRLFSNHGYKIIVLSTA